MKLWWVVLVALWPAATLAQPVFFDDFEGDALLPHWNQPPPSHWEHNVSNSMLNVTRLLYPSHFKSPSNFTRMTAAYAPQGDFAMDAWMGWELPSGPFHQLDVSVLVGESGIMATFGYRQWPGRMPEIFASATGQGTVTMPAPPPGVYHFMINRVGTQFGFYLDGDLFTSLRDRDVFPAGGVRVFLSTPYPGEWGAFHVDRVQVVPAPGPLALGAALAIAIACRRTRRSACAT